MTTSTVRARHPQPCSLTIRFVAAGLSFVMLGQTEVGAVCRTSHGYQAVSEITGEIIGLFDRHYEAVAAVRQTVAPF